MSTARETKVLGYTRRLAAGRRSTTRFGYREDRDWEGRDTVWRSREMTRGETIRRVRSDLDEMLEVEFRGDPKQSLKEIKKIAKAELKHSREIAEKIYAKSVEEAKREYALSSKASREQYEKAKESAKENFENAQTIAQEHYNFTMDIARDQYKNEKYRDEVHRKRKGGAIARPHSASGEWNAPGEEDRDAAAQYGLDGETGRGGDRSLAAAARYDRDGSARGSGEPGSFTTVDPGRYTLDEREKFTGRRGTTSIIVRQPMEPEAAPAAAGLAVARYPFDIEGKA